MKESISRFQRIILALRGQIANHSFVRKGVTIARSGVLELTCIVGRFNHIRGKAGRQVYAWEILYPSKHLGVLKGEYSLASCKKTSASEKVRRFNQYLLAQIRRQTRGENNEE
jgi:hypothetical protein